MSDGYLQRLVARAAGRFHGLLLDSVVPPEFGPIGVDTWGEATEEERFGHGIANGTETRARQLEPHRVSPGIQHRSDQYAVVTGPAERVPSSISRSAANGPRATREHTESDSRGGDVRRRLIKQPAVRERGTVEEAPPPPTELEAIHHPPGDLTPSAAWASTDSRMPKHTTAYRRTEPRRSSIRTTGTGQLAMAWEKPPRSAGQPGLAPLKPEGASATSVTHQAANDVAPGVPDAAVVLRGQHQAIPIRTGDEGGTPAKLEQTQTLNRNPRPGSPVDRALPPEEIVQVTIDSIDVRNPAPTPSPHIEERGVRAIGFDDYEHIRSYRSRVG